MTALELWTRVAIWILIGGSIAVFGWFLRDLLRLARPRRRTPPPEER